MARAALQVGVGFAHSGPLGLLLGQFAGETAGSASLSLAAWRKDRAPFKAVSLRGIRQAGTRYKRFPLFSSWGSLLDALGGNVPQLLFAAFYGAVAAGWFALGQRVIAAPLNIVVDSVAQVYFGEAARLPRSDPKAMRRLFFKLTARLALVGGLPVVMICTLAPWFFPFFFGQGWETAGRYVQILGLMFGLRLAVVPISQTLNILEQQHWFLAWQATWMGLGTGALLAAKAVGVSHIAAVALYSLAMTMAYVLLLIISWHALLKKSEESGEGNRK